MSTNRPAASAAGRRENPELRARAFEGWAPQVGVICLYRLDGEARPFLPVCLPPGNEVEVCGWIFPCPPVDAERPALREMGLQASQRQQPCYCVVRRADLHPVVVAGRTR